MKLTDIKVVHLEHTSKCNLLCPQCARTVDGNVNPLLELSELTLKDYKKIFTPEFSPQIERVFWCGNYGDSIASGNWMECAFWLRYSGVQSMQLYTNGSARKPDWWKKLAIIFNRKRDAVYFSIDGMEDTNHLYRVNSNWKIIMKNAEAFINAGGKARWDYLIFDHNAHQVKDAYNLAKEMGFRQIVFKNTSRFISNKEFLDSMPRDEEEVIDRKTQEKKHIIADKDNKNKNKFELIIEKYGNWNNYVNDTSIDCKYQNMKAIYINFKGQLWPCCWVGAPTHFYGKDNIQRDQLENLLTRYDENFNSIKKNSVKEILEHQYHNNDLVESWTNTMEDDNAKLHTCGRTCGSMYEFSSGMETSNAKRYYLNERD
jgi:sulfatase maturation enzyme AslB (radical SAM superfamily)